MYSQGRNVVAVAEDFAVVPTEMMPTSARKTKVKILADWKAWMWPRTVAEFAVPWREFEQIATLIAYDERPSGPTRWVFVYVRWV